LPRELEEVADLLRGFEPLAPEPALEEAALAAAGEGDPDVALGNLLIARGLLDADRAAEAWGLLQAYRRELPAVELSHVLRKHAMVEEAPLRALWAEIEERDRPAPPDAPAATTAPAPPPPAIGAGARAAAPP